MPVPPCLALAGREDNLQGLSRSRSRLGKPLPKNAPAYAGVGRPWSQPVIAIIECLRYRAGNIHTGRAAI